MLFIYHKIILDYVTLIDYQLFHNYIRPHNALDGMTSSEKHGIEINGDNNWITLIQNAYLESKQG